jgi:hypothetical protein
MPVWESLAFGRDGDPEDKSSSFQVAVDYMHRVQQVPGHCQTAARRGQTNSFVFACRALLTPSFSHRAASLSFFESLLHRLIPAPPLARAALLLVSSLTTTLHRAWLIHDCRMARNSRLSRSRPSKSHPSKMDREWTQDDLLVYKIKWSIKTSRHSSA